VRLFCVAATDWVRWPVLTSHWTHLLSVAVNTRNGEGGLRLWLRLGLVNLGPGALGGGAGR
jgi:hypothetical protein